MNDEQQLVIFESEAGKVEVRLEGESVWLTQAHMAELFATSTDNISLHLKNIYRNKELQEVATTEDFSVVRQEGHRRSARTPDPRLHPESPALRTERLRIGSRPDPGEACFI